MFRMKNLTLLMIAMLAALLIVGCGGSGKDAETEQGGDSQATETVVILKTTQGDIAVRFFPDIAPEHVKNFVEHSKSGLYAGTLFHRVIPGFMIQGGDPNSKDDDPNNDGMGGYSYMGPGTNLIAEFSDTPHKRGILSMARSPQGPDTAGSQFFIMHQDYPSLDGQYSVFGEVVDGIEVVDAIANTPRNRRDRPNTDQRINEVEVVQWPVSKVEKSKADMWAEDRGEH